MIEELVAAVGNLSSRQGRNIRLFMAMQDADYLKFAEDISERAVSLAGGIELAAEAYNQVCADILREQIRYSRTGTYFLQTAQQANDSIYSQPSMREYAIGLLLSYIFWPNHYKMWRFYEKHIRDIPVTRVLEIGAGHGLFSAHMIKKSPESQLDIIDISKLSVILSCDMMRAHGALSDNVKFVVGDFLSVDLSDQYDFLIMGEVLEHVDKAHEFLRRAYDALRSGGKAYLSTCSNCPALDHVWHFHSVNEIRRMIDDAGFMVWADLILPVSSFPDTTNYCAILEKP